MTDNTTVLDFNAKLSESSEAGETFYKLFYDYLDKKRSVSFVRALYLESDTSILSHTHTFLLFCLQLMSHFYSDDSMMLWNGNAYTGSSDINSFYQTLPPTEHVLLSVDCQPVPGEHPECINILLITSPFQTSVESNLQSL